MKTESCVIDRLIFVGSSILQIAHDVWTLLFRNIEYHISFALVLDLCRSFEYAEDTVSSRCFQSSKFVQTPAILPPYPQKLIFLTYIYRNIREEVRRSVRGRESQSQLLADSPCQFLDTKPNDVYVEHRWLMRCFFSGKERRLYS